MARTRGSLNWQTKQKYLHDKFPNQGWMEESEKRVIDKHYKAVVGGQGVLDLVVEESQNMELYK